MFPKRSIAMLPIHLDVESGEKVPCCATTGTLLGSRISYQRGAATALSLTPIESLVTNHSIGVSDRAVAAPRWYEIRDPSNVPVVAQQGTFSPDSTSRWIGSIAMDRFGNIGLGYSAS